MSSILRKTGCVGGGGGGGVCLVPTSEYLGVQRTFKYRTDNKKGGAE